MAEPMTEEEEIARIRAHRERKLREQQAQQARPIPPFPPTGEDKREGRGAEGQDYAHLTSSAPAEPARARVARWKAVKDEHPGWTDDEAWAAVDADTELLEVVPARARTEDTRAALDAARSDDAGEQVLAMATGGRSIPIERVAEPPPQAERDREYRALEMQGRSAGLRDLVTTALGIGKEAKPIEAGGEEDKPWVRGGRDYYLSMLVPHLVVADTVAHAFGMDIPLVPHVGRQLESVGEMGTVVDDPDVVGAANIPAVAERLVVKSGAGEKLGELAEVAGLDTHGKAMQRFFEDATYLPAFDPVAKMAHEARTAEEKLAARQALDAIAYRDLPERGAQRPIDVPTWRRAVESGTVTDPEVVRRVKEGMADGAVDLAIRLLPVGEVARVQPSAVPTTTDIALLYPRRASAQEATGSAEADALARVVNAGLYDSDEDAAGGIVLVPSKFQNIAAGAGLASEAVYQADVKSWPLMLASSPVAALAMFGTLKGTGQDELLGQVMEARAPTKAGIEKMAATGKWDATTERWGFLPASQWALVDDRDSTFKGRLAATLAMPDYQGPGYASLYRRGGGADATTEKLLSSFDVGLDVLLPAEEMILGPVGFGLGRVNRGMKAARLSGKGLEAFAAVAPVAFDDVGAFARYIDPAVRADIDAGRPVFMDDVLKQDVEQRWRDAGIEPNEAWPALDAYMKERAARTMDETARMLARSGTPEVQAARKSPGYKRVKAEMAALPNYSAADVDATMAVLEVKAQHAVDGGAAASLEDFFDGVRYEQGGTPGAGAFVSKKEGATAGSIEPTAATNWLIRIFKGGDIDTLAHENAHLLRFVMGDRWTDDLARFFKHEPDPARPGKMRLTREGEEQVAEAIRLAIRKDTRAGGRARRYIEDAVDAVRDLWLRARNQPLPIPPEFKAWWDATLDPARAVRRPSVAVGTDRVAPSGLRVATGPEEIEALRQAGPVRKMGAREDAMRVAADPRSARQAVGVRAGDTSADVVDAFVRAYTDVQVGRFRRSWGTERLVALTGRTVVPASRVAAVEKATRDRLATAGLDVKNMKGGVLALDVASKARLKALVDAVVVEPLGETLPVSLLDPAATHVTMADWNALSDTVTDIVAGPGARRDRRAERAAMSGLRAVVAMIDERVLGDGTVMGNIRDEVVQRFDVGTLGDDYINDAGKLERLERARREIGEAPEEIKRRVIAARDRMGAGATMDDLFHDVAAGTRARFDVNRVADLERIEGVFSPADATDVGKVFDAMTEADAAGGLAGILAVAERGLSDFELAAVANLEAARAGWAAGTMPADFLATDMVFAQSLAIVKDGLRRRWKAIDDVARTVVQGLSGSADEAAIVGKEPGRWRKMATDTYRQWYGGPAGWQELWRSLVRSGQETVARQGGKFDPQAATVATLVRLRAMTVLSDLADDMVASGFPVAADDFSRRGVTGKGGVDIGSRARAPVAHADIVAQYVRGLTGWETTDLVLLDDAGKVKGRLPAGARDLTGGIEFEAYADAQRVLHAWGWKYGKGTGWTRRVMASGEEVILPDLLWAEIDDVTERSARLGVGWEYRWKDSGGKPGSLAAAVDKAVRPAWNAISWTLGMARVGVTTGIIIPNPAYYVGNLFGGMLQAYSAAGLRGVFDVARSAPFLPGERAGMTRAVMARMWKDGSWKPSSPVIVDARGRVYDADAIARMASDFGLNSSFVKAEAPTKLVEDIKRQQGGWWTRWQRDPLMPARWWQDTMMEGATAIDNYYRVALFVDGLKRGVDPSEAAALARLAAFDYGALTDFEKNYARTVVMFYSFIRRNADLQVWTLLNHPSRFMGQLRGLRDAQQMALGDDSEARWSEYMDGRLALYFQQAAADGAMAHAKEGTLTLAPPIPASDFVSLYVDAMGWIEGDEVARRETLARLTPWAQLPIVAGLGIEPFSGRDVEDYNMVPAWLVEGSRAWDGGVLVDDILRVETIQQRDPATEEYPGAPRYQARNGMAWWTLRNLVQVFPGGRAMDTATQAERADVPILRPGPVVDWLRERRAATGAPVAPGAVIAAERWIADLLPSIDTSGEAVYEEPSPVDDLATARPGLTEAQELGGMFAIKPVQVDAGDVAAARMAREVESRAREEGGKARRSAPLKRERER